MTLDRIIRAARGEEPAELVFKNARIVDVFTGQIVPGDLAVSAGTILGIGPYTGRRCFDLGGRFLAPGFIDPHVHIESTMTVVAEFARAVVPCGTTTVCADPHEIANVLGTEGIDSMLRASTGQPLNVFFTLPSCVPATPMETAGATLNAGELAPYFEDERVVALGEMMNFPGVLHADPAVLGKIEIARSHRKPADGHAPGLAGMDLNAYAAAGIASDHECSTAAEARAKLAAGMHIMIREGSAARNLAALLPVVDRHNARRMMWCTDDRHPHDLLGEGHIDSIVRQAIRLGLDPMTAIQLATLNPAEYFGLKTLGAIAPGRQADLVVFSDLACPRIEAVYVRGVEVARDGRMTVARPASAAGVLPTRMNVPLERVDLRVPLQGERMRVIVIVPDQIVTRQQILGVSARDGAAVADPARDLLKIAVVERYTGSARTGIGFVRGLGLKRGALAASVAHDAHNLIVVGADDDAMRTALAALVATGGGLVAVDRRGVRAQLPLPFAGLMSPEPVEKVKAALDELLRAAWDLGARLKDPFMTLSFLALAVIPELKITDHGLIDVNRFAPVPLFIT
jgi:adenine deaminase